MARKVAFDIPQDDDKPAMQIAPAERIQSRAPALSGMAKSLQDASQSAIQELNTDLIDDSEFTDRLATDDDEDIRELADSINRQGQLIPILVTPSGGRYRIIYGRRRLAALKLLGKPAKALIRPLDEDQAILAQGQENSFRKDLSWIEKALFAHSLLASGKDEGLVCDALNIDQKARKTGEKLTGLVRMRQVTSCLPTALINAIGPAPSVGRDRWYSAAKTYERLGFPAGNQSAGTVEGNGFPAGNQTIMETLSRSKAAGSTSDERFAEFEGLLKVPNPVEKTELQTKFGSIKVTKRHVVITVPNADNGLHNWIAENPEAALTALADARSAAATAQGTEQKPLTS